MTAEGGRGDLISTHDTLRSGCSGGTRSKVQHNDLSSRPDPEMDEHSAVPQNVDEMVLKAESYCKEFVFPPHMRVVKKAFIRLIVYSKYGPAIRDPVDRQLKLPGSGRLLRAYEEKILLHEEERNLITDTYGGNMASKDLVGPPEPIDSTTEALLAMKRDPLFYTAMELSKKELDDVLRNVNYDAAHAAARKGVSAKSTATPLSAAAVSQSPSRATRSEGLADPAAEERRQQLILQRQRSVVDDTLSNALLDERRRRIRELQVSVPVFERIRLDIDVTQRKTMRFYNRTQPKAYELRSWEDPKDVLRALHRSAFQVTEFSDRNNPAVNLNVRCLRAEYKPKSADAPGWDPYCCVRQTLPGKAQSLRIF